MRVAISRSYVLFATPLLSSRSVGIPDPGCRPDCRDPRSSSLRCHPPDFRAQAEGAIERLCRVRVLGRGAEGSSTQGWPAAFSRVDLGSEIAAGRFLRYAHSRARTAQGERRGLAAALSSRCSKTDNLLFEAPTEFVSLHLQVIASLQVHPERW